MLLTFRKVKKTQRPHSCVWCSQRVEKGGRAIYRSYLFDGEFQYDYLHPECYSALNHTEDIENGWDAGGFARGRTDDDTSAPPEFDEFGARIPSQVAI